MVIGAASFIIMPQTRYIGHTGRANGAGLPDMQGQGHCRDQREIPSGRRPWNPTLKNEGFTRNTAAATFLITIRITTHFGFDQECLAANRMWLDYGTVTPCCL